MTALYWILWNIWLLNKAGKVTEGGLTSICFYKEINIHLN